MYCQEVHIEVVPAPAVGALQRSSLDLAPSQPLIIPSLLAERWTRISLSVRSLPHVRSSLVRIMSITDRQVMAELLCAEKMVECVAPTDPVIFQDPRVLDILLRTELNYVPKCNYLTNQVQPDLLPYMRKVVATWMMEVCRSRTHSIAKGTVIIVLSLDRQQNRLSFWQH